MEVDSHREFKGCYSSVRQSRMKNGRIIAVKAIDPLWMQEGDIVSVNELYTCHRAVLTYTPILAQRQGDIYLGRPPSAREHPPVTGGGDSLWPRNSADIPLGQLWF